MTDIEARRFLAYVIHEFAQPCASAALAVDTALELARRAAAEEIIERLTSAAQALEDCQAILKQAAEFARTGRASDFVDGTGIHARTHV